jgi:hypothetical protein
MTIRDKQNNDAYFAESRRASYLGEVLLSSPLLSAKIQEIPGSHPSIRPLVLGPLWENELAAHSPEGSP